MLSQSSFEDQAATSTGPERIASDIERVLRSHATRTELRALVERYADLARLGGIPLSDALARLDGVTARAAATDVRDDTVMAVGDSVNDRHALIARWCSVRYQRAD